MVDVLQPASALRSASNRVDRLPGDAAIAKVLALLGFGCQQRQLRPNHAADLGRRFAFRGLSAFKRLAVCPNWKEPRHRPAKPGGTDFYVFGRAARPKSFRGCHRSLGRLSTWRP